MMEEYTEDVFYQMEEELTEPVEELDYEDTSNQYLFTRNKTTVKNVIINEDYNLNSPIMPDIITNIYNYVNHNRKISHHSNRTNNIFKPFEKIITKGNVGDINSSYTIMRKFLLNEEINPKVYDFIETWNTEFNTIKAIPDLFLNSISSHAIKINLKDIIMHSKTLLGNLSKFLELTYLTEIMVNQDRRSFNSENNNYIITPVNEFVSQITAFYWIGYVSKDLLYDSNKKVIIDKNMILMLKDITIGRFNTELVAALNINNDYSVDIVKVFNKMIKSGDLYLLSRGNEGFDEIALLETICVNRMNELANISRPEILISKHFSNYIDSKHNTGVSKIDNFVRLIKELVNSVDKIEDLTVLFGSFRLWGHPYIEYEIGLGKLKEQVRMEKPLIDKNYCNLLASDLMKASLIKYYKENNKWNVIDNEHNRSIKGADVLIKNMWPKHAEMKLLEGKWHELEIMPLREIPEDISDSNLFADKTHSLTKREVLAAAKKNPNNPIPTERVLVTYLKSERVNIKEFVNKIDNNGIDENHLIIGLKAKERELKRFGRFFTLMSWELRLYFVISEYLIKKDLVPMFRGLTMADGAIAVMEKMLERTKGQRGHKYDYITYANHIDYSKWNNHQRDEAVGPTFSVIDKIYGLKNFFRRTHNIFKECMIYYPERPEFMNKDSPYFWEGQPGGFEGIRQKGWSLVGILCLLRESKVRNTEVDLLAQGDNQVVFCKYKLPNFFKDSDRKTELEKIFHNNEFIMQKILEASTKIGLIINQDETVQSANFAIYGKIPIFKGNILNLVTKKACRISGVTNDQLPTSANIMSSVNSTSLSICQQDPNLLNGVYLQAIFGLFVLNCVKRWNSISMKSYSTSPLDIYKLIRWLYHDKSLGGNTGMALTRLLIRRFPDPITESLSFYKMIYGMTTNKYIRDAMIELGNPEMRNVTLIGLNRLAEDPTCLNIKKGSDIAVLIKSQVKQSLISRRPFIKNNYLSNALKDTSAQENYVLKFIDNITPCFPRLLADFKSSSVCGYIDNIIGLVQNSKTVRTMFNHEFENKVKKLSVDWEDLQYLKMISDPISKVNMTMWNCSSTHADNLRNTSWKKNIVGATIPHPYEYNNLFIKDIKEHVIHKKDVLTCLVSPDVKLNNYYHGPNKPYLGSNTKESSGVTHEWEKELTNPLYKKAADLRRIINWMTNSGSNLSLSVLNNLNYVTGMDIKEEGERKRVRTGTAQHRYKTSRQDNGGFCNITPNILSWFTVTSDNMNDLSDVNYDFMFQASLIYAETVGAHILKYNNNLCSFGLGISCKDCIRPLSELTIDSKYVYNPSLINSRFWLSNVLKTDIKVNIEKYETLLIETEQVPNDFSYTAGLHHGIGLMIDIGKLDDNFNISDILTMGIMLKVNPKDWLQGLVQGVSVITGYMLLNHPEFINGGRSLSMFRNKLYRNFKLLSLNNDFLSRIKIDNITNHLVDVTNYYDPNYPAVNDECGSRLMSTIYGELEIILHDFRSYYKKLTDGNIIIYSDYNVDIFKKILIIGIEVIDQLVSDSKNHNRSKKFLNLKRCLLDEDDIRNYSTLVNKILVTDKELKTHAEMSVRKITEITRSIYPDDKLRIGLKHLKLGIHNAQNSYRLPGEGLLIRSLKPYKCATGAHYKMNNILNNIIMVEPNLVFVGGDGSGGFTAMILRKYLRSQVIFNSILEQNGEDLKGGNPGMPQALRSLPVKHRERCLNYQYCWTEPNDLSQPSCWENAIKYTKRFNTTIKYDLILIDAECRDLESFSRIYKLLVTNYSDLMSRNGLLIIKSYCGIIEDTYKLITADQSLNVSVVQSKYCSEFTTEIYLIISKDDVEFRLIDEQRSIEDFNMSLRSITDEFNRALSIDIKYLIKTIPRDNRENYKNLFITTMSTVGLTTSISEYIYLLILSDKYIEGINMILDYSIFKNMEIDEVPSNQVLRKLISIITGIATYKSFKNKDPTLYESCLKIENNNIYVSISKNHNMFYISLEKSLQGCYSKLIYPGSNVIAVKICRSLIMSSYLITDIPQLENYYTELDTNISEILN